MKEKVSKIMKTVIALMLAAVLAMPVFPETAEAASKPSAPAITKVANTSSGVAVTWKKVSSASGYYVYRKTTGGFSKIATINKNSTVTYTDKKASAGKTYTYAVKAYKGKSVSGYGKSTKIKRLTQPSVKTSNTSSGIKISWGKVSGASKYRIYYKKSGKWVKLTDTTSTSYTDKSVKSGSSRTYTVKAISGSSSSSYMSGKTLKRLSQPAVKVSNTASGVKISWGKVTGAEKYRVYYKKDGTWTKLTDTTSLSYTDKTIASGVSRTYTVKAISGSSSSSYVSGKTLTYIGQPVVSISTTAEGLKVSWSKVNGAAKYRVFRKNAEGKWAKLADTSSISYTDKAVEDGKSYTYTVRCITADGKSYTSSYDTKGVTATYKHTHNYTSKVTKETTCTENGIRTYTCSICGNTYTESIPATGHRYESKVTKSSTCTEDGVKTYTCKNCGHSYTETIPATGHKYESKVTKAATCEEDGIRTYTCKNCGDSYTETIPSLGHDWEDLTETKTTTEKVWVVDKEAYDEEVETHKHYHQCTGCGEKFYWESETEEGNEKAVNEWLDHCDTCPYEDSGYTTKYDVVIETVHHDEEGHYEEKTVTETVVIGKKCKRCGLEELK